ncbi:hypothetical protein HDU67_003761 [Dinochytrium kinnereticum]|nr:hypothetical protein HDU67_003761 [Dinochytrium kinnereticum]
MHAFIFAIVPLLLASSAEARFGQEGKVGFGALITAAFPGCTPDPDSTLGFGGQEIATLLGGAEPCLKLQMADQLVEKAKRLCPAANVPDMIDAAMELVAAEKNFDPFQGKLDSVCLDASLPRTPELRGILQKVDPRDAAGNANDPADVKQAAAAINTLAAQVLAKAKADGRGPGFNGGSMANLLAFQMTVLLNPIAFSSYQANGFTAIKGFTGAAAPVPPAQQQPPPLPAQKQAPAPPPQQQGQQQGQAPKAKKQNNGQQNKAKKNKGMKNNGQMNQGQQQQNQGQQQQNQGQKQQNQGQQQQNQGQQQQQNQGQQQQGQNNQASIDQAKTLLQQAITLLQGV